MLTYNIDMTSTPLRVSAGDVSILAGSITTRQDAASRSLRALIESAPALPSWSTDLVGRASAAEQLHVDPARANLLRAFEIPSDWSVLEIGSGAGAVTRYLGETAGVVDALEPDAELASLAAIRTSDLPNVRVFSGTLADVPSTAAYDLIVAINVLPIDADAFVASATALLLPGGTLLIAEPNKLGVKYLVGSPDDNTGEPFDSLEGYPRRDETKRARSRADLVKIVGRAALDSRVMSVVPDHLATRAVLDPERFTGEHARLMSDLALTPSPDRAAPRARLADESSLWRELVAAGVGAEFSNSFVVLATASSRPRNADEVALWPDDRLGVYFSWARTAEYSATSVVVRRNDTVFIDRVYPYRDASSRLRVFDGIAPFVRGVSLAEAMIGAEDKALRAWFTSWRELLERISRTPAVWLDAHPGNIIIGADGALTAIDLEFESSEHDLDYAMRRGLLSVARQVAMMTHPSLWPASFSTIRDIALHYGDLAGYGRDSGWLERAAREEAALQKIVAGTRSAMTLAESEAQMTAVLDTALSDLPLGRRDLAAVEERDAAHVRLGVFDQRIRALEDHERLLESTVRQQHDRTRQQHAHILTIQENLAAHQKHVVSLENRIATACTEVNSSEKILRDEIDALRSSRMFAVATRMRALLDRVAPEASLRRRILKRLVSRWS